MDTAGCGAGAMWEQRLQALQHGQGSPQRIDRQGTGKAWQNKGVECVGQEKGDVRFRHIRFTGNRITGRKDLDTSMLFFDYEEVCGVGLFDGLGSV